MTTSMIRNVLGGQGNMRRRLGCGVIGIPLLIALLGLAACAGASRSSSVSRPEKIVLLPTLNIGEEGWCLMTIKEALESTGCGTTIAGYPIVAQTFSAGGNPPEAQGIDLTTNAVTAISVNGGSPIPTHSELLLPPGLRVAEWSIPGETSSDPGFPPHVTPLGDKGIAVAQTMYLDSQQVAQHGLLVELPWRAVSPGSHRAKTCAIDSAKRRGLSLQSADAVSALEGLLMRVGKPYLVCAMSEYQLEGWPISASVLIDAQHPGVRPQELPLMKAIPGKPGVYASLSSEGPSVARRIAGGGWLVVFKGKGRAQQLTLLQSLRVSIGRKHVTRDAA